MGRRLLLLCVALSLTACAGVPSSSPVRVVRRIPAEQPELPEAPAFRRRLPPNPPENATPTDIVRGFLLAQGSSDGDHAIARKYLAPTVPWNPAQSLTVYTSPRIGEAVVRGDSATVVATLQRIGTLTRDGEFRPPLSVESRQTFRLRRDPSLGWRLAEAPPGVLLTRDDLTASYQRFTLYFPNAARRLVPHQVFLRQSDQPAATAVRALLTGPRGWLAPAVRSSIPEGTELLDPPTVVDGVVTLNFSREIRRAPQETLGLLVAQVVWTLTEPALAVEAVRIQAEGQELVVPGHDGAREHRRPDWEEFAPAPRPFDDRLFFVRDGAPYALDAGGAVARVAALTGVRSFAVNRSGTHLVAVVRLAGGREALDVVALSGPGGVRRALTADTLTAPAWDPTSDVAWVAATTGGTTQVMTVPVTGTPAPVPASLPGGTVTSLRLSPDGSRVALLVAGPGRAALFVGRVERTATGARAVADPRAIAPSVSLPTAVTFDGAGQVVVAGTLAGRRALVRLDVDGFTRGTIRDQGLPPGPVTALASSAATPPDRVASVAGRMWRRTPGADWAAIVGNGTAATYAG